MLSGAEGHPGLSINDEEMHNAHNQNINSISDLKKGIGFQKTQKPPFGGSGSNNTGYQSHRSAGGSRPSSKSVYVNFQDEKAKAKGKTLTALAKKGSQRHLGLNFIKLKHQHTEYQEEQLYSLQATELSVFDKLKPNKPRQSEISAFTKK